MPVCDLHRFLFVRKGVKSDRHRGNPSAILFEDRHPVRGWFFLLYPGGPVHHFKRGNNET
jgi:hypothetical protein